MHIDDLPENVDLLAPVPLLAVLLQQRLSGDTIATYQALCEGFQREAAEARAELNRVVEGIRELCCGPYAPNPLAILDVLEGAHLMRDGAQ